MKRQDCKSRRTELTEWVLNNATIMSVLQDAPYTGIRMIVVRNGTLFGEDAFSNCWEDKDEFDPNEGVRIAKKRAARKIADTIMEFENGLSEEGV